MMDPHITPRELLLAALVLAARAVDTIAPTLHVAGADDAVVEDLLVRLRHRFRSRRYLQPPV